ncbi:MAG: flippase [Methylobacter sp.]|uniref:flippase n=1 Tax=Methylobacter sp. TaxID=2051955 RepID=UPI002730DCED|nr:flippase [Methylobacter sp.]MDP1666743.1 flippase [Methylobacter sp.]
MTSNKGHVQVLRNIAWHSSEKALRMLIGFLVGLWLARYLGPEQFGRFNYITAWLGMFGAIAWLGVGDTMMRDMVRDRADEDRIMGSAFMIRLCGSLLAIALMLAAARPLGGFNETDFMLLAILCVGVPFAETTGGIWIWFASHTNIGPAVLGKNISIIIGALLRVGVIVAGAGLIGLMTVLTLESVLYWMCLVGAYWWYGERFSHWRFDTRHAWRMLLTGLPIILNTLVASLNAGVDQVMLGRLTSMTEVGVYAAAMRFSGIWWVVPPMIVQSLASRYIYPKDLGEQLQSNVARIIAGMALLSLIPCVFISAIGPEMISMLLGDQYLGASSVLMIHIWMAVLIFIDAPVNQYLLATYRQSQLVVKSVVLLLFNFGLALFLVPRYGAPGAAVATLIAQTATVLVLPMLYPPLRDVFGIYRLAINEVRPLLAGIYSIAINKTRRFRASCTGLMSIGSQRWRSMGLGAAPRNYASGHAKISNLALISGLGICAVLMGLLAVTANPVMIGLGVCLVLGPVLLIMPELTIWLILVIGFLLGVLSAGALSKVTWGVSLLSMLLLIPSLTNILWSKQRRAPGFMLIALLFLVYAVGVSIVQCYSLVEFVAGFKRYFQSFGLMMALTMIAFTPQNYVRWRQFLMAVALLQFPFALYELVVLVPLRGGLSLSSYTTDVVAGTFGANLEGGSPNSVMVIYLFIALSFLSARWRAGLISSKIFYPLAFICLLPLGMGETKIAVIMLPLVGLILLKDDLISAPLRFLPAIIMLALLTMLLGYLYVVIIMHSSLDQVVAATLRYNVGDQGYSGEAGSLNRWTAITFWAQHNWHDLLGFIIGNGLGSSYTSLNNLAGHLGLKYLNYGIDLTAASTLLWDTGLIGFMMFVSIFIAAWGAAGKLRRSVSDPTVRADALAIQMAISLFLLDVVYSASSVNLVSMELIYAIVLGYLGYLMNYHGLLGRQRCPVSSSKQTSVKLNA